jgi:hypothetical protein
MATESQLHILAHTARILRREIENILAGGLAPEDGALPGFACAPAVP